MRAWILHSQTHDLILLLQVINKASTLLFHRALLLAICLVSHHARPMFSRSLATVFLHDCFEPGSLVSFSVRSTPWPFLWCCPLPSLVYDRSISTSFVLPLFLHPLVQLLPTVTHSRWHLAKHMKTILLSFVDRYLEFNQACRAD